MAGIEFHADRVAATGEVGLLDRRRDRVNFSDCENAPPIRKLPVGFSTTVTLTSTWSVVPCASGVSMVTSLK